MATMLAVNRTRKKRKSTNARSKAPATRRRRRYSAPKSAPRRRRRRNPIGGNVMGQIGDSFMGASGALLTDLILQKMPYIPAQAKTGWMAGITRAIGAISLGWGMKQLKMGNAGRKMTQGALTVIMSDVLRQTVGKQVGLSGMGVTDDYDIELDSLMSGLGESEFDDIEFAGLGQGVDADFDDLLSGYEMAGYEEMSGMGYMSPAPIMSGIPGEAI